MHKATSAPPAPVIEAVELTKRFDDIVAVDRVTFAVQPAEILGLLGPNGAGKTTTLQLLLGLTTPTSGRVSILGLDIRRQRRQILSRVNLAAADIHLPSNLTVWENLNVFARLYGLRRPQAVIAELLDFFDISAIMHVRTGTLSTGQRTRLNLAKALINRPDILFLDEPTASLDPEIAAKVRDLLRRINQEQGMTMIYTSHNMHEIEQMCNRILFLSRGRIVLEGSPAEVKAQTMSQSLEDLFITIARNGIVRQAAPPEG